MNRTDVHCLVTGTSDFYPAFAPQFSRLGGSHLSHSDQPPLKNLFWHTNFNRHVATVTFSSITNLSFLVDMKIHDRMHPKGKSAKPGSSGSSMNMEPEMNIRNIMKEIDFLTSSHMSWKDKKETENRKIVSLGGKPQKKQKLALGVARPIMKKQKEREQKMIQERLNLGQFGGMASRNNSRRSLGKRKPEDQVLRSSEGFFKNGVLDVKHMLQPAPSRNTDFGNEMVVGGGRRKGGKKNKSKKKGGGKKRH